MGGKGDHVSPPPKKKGKLFIIIYIIIYCGGCKTTALHSIIEKKVNKNSENIKRNTVI